MNILNLILLLPQMFLLCSLLFIFCWPIYFVIIVTYYYVRLFRNFIRKIATKEWTSPKIKLERYYSLFRTPLIFYFSLPMTGAILEEIITTYFFKHNYGGGSSLRMFVECVIVLAIFWGSVYLVFSFENKKKEIKKTTKAHKKFIKATMFPLGLLSILVSVTSVINMFIDAEVKKEFLSELSKADFNQSYLAFCILFIIILLLEGISLVFIELIEHFYDNEKEYGYYIKTVFNCLKRLI